MSNLGFTSPMVQGRRRLPAGQEGGVPTVVYIAGSGRSGSTLLERALGGIPGFVNVGELIDLFRRGASRAERCGCGQHFADCPFWASARKHAFGDETGALLAIMHPLQRRVARPGSLPALVAMPLAGPRFRAGVARYGEGYAAIYRAVAAEAGSGCVVDASKWPVQALALARSGIDIRVIHLVRDARGVAHSLTKRGQKPQVTAARWVIQQLQASLLRWCGLPITRMRYEDFARGPRQAVTAALTELGLPRPPADLAHVGDRQITLHPSHGIHGNPLRSRHGEILVSPDESWREKMPMRDRVLVTMITWPMLLWYRIRPGL
jgi:hypothetical protein